MKDSAELRDWYLALSEAGKLVALALVSNQLTIHGRVVGLDLAGEEQSKAFKGLNELQHQLSGHIAALGSEDARYPDDVLWNILQEKAAVHGLRSCLNQSFEFAQSRDFFALKI